MRNAGKSGDFTGRTLGIASSYNDFAVRVLPANAPNSSPGVLFGRRGYRAGVQNDVLGPARGVGALQPLVPELPFNRRPVCLSGPATEILDKKARQSSYYRRRVRSARIRSGSQC